MTAYIVGRLAAVVPVLLGISVVVFVLLRLTPGDPALMLAGPQASKDELDVVRRSLGLDQPIPVQFAFWLGRAVRGDLGRSSLLGSQVSDLVVKRFGNTVLLASTSLLLAMLIAIPAGIVSARLRGSPFDNVVMGLTLLANCMPSYWTGLMMILVFTATLGWLPSGGMYDVTGDGGLWDLGRHLVMPTLTLGLLSTALIA